MSKNLRFRIIVGALAVFAIVAGFLILNRSEASADSQGTDDAYVQAEQHTAILLAEVDKARAGLLAAKAAKEAAELNLSYANIVAPVNGVVAQRRARVGGYARVQVGQPVEITVDALPDVRLKGRVESLAPASGVSFSIVPAHNATGNFTKIVQRLPVRIQLEPDQKDISRLRVGMPVQVTMIVMAEEVERIFAHLEKEELRLFYMKVPVEFGIIGE